MRVTRWATTMVVAAVLVAGGVTAGPSPVGAAEVTDVGPIRFAKALAMDLFGHSGRSDWLEDVEARMLAGTPRSRIVSEAVRSRDHTLAVVVDLYRRILFRPPVRDEFDYWSARLSSGHKVTEVVVAVLTSAEARRRFALDDDAAFVDYVYARALGRQADAGGRAHWVGRLEAGTPRASVARAIWMTFEGRRRRVGETYELLLDRAPSAADRDYWANRLATQDEVTLRGQLAASPEYLARSRRRGDTVSRPTTLDVTTVNGTGSLGLGADADGSVVVIAHTTGTGVVVTHVEMATSVADALVFEIGAPAFTGLDVSADGNEVAVGLDGTVQVYDQDAGTGTPIGPQTPEQGRGDDPLISADGSLVAYTRSADGGAPDIVVHDLDSGTDEVIADGNGPSLEADISPDGRWVAFRSAASDLVPGDTNGQVDVFLHDRQTGTTQRSDSHPSWPSSEPAVSPDGSQVAFLASRSTEGPRAWVWDVASGERTEISQVWDEPGSRLGPTVDAPAWGGSRYVALAPGGSTSGAFVRDLTLDTVSALPRAVGAVHVAATADGGDLFATMHVGGRLQINRWELDGAVVR